MSVYRLLSPVRPYAWGSHRTLAELQGRPVPTERPEAELWIGAHPTAPAGLPDGRTLRDLIERDPVAALGPHGAELPFLLKILAVEHPLSLQVHPDPEQARAGFRREQAAGVPLDDPHRSYHDDQPKPELICAVTPFTALCGWADPAISADLLASLRVAALDGVVADLRAGDLRAAVTALLGWPADQRPEVVTAVRAACAHLADPRGAWTVRLAEEYPGDMGVVTAMLLNLLVLEPGEALFLPGRTIHAYLYGTGVEILSSSDNVLRGGLTPKYVDVPELLAVTDFHPVRPERVVPEPNAAGGLTYASPAPQFRLSVYRVTDVTVLAEPGPGAVLCLEGEITVRRGKDSVALTPGTAAFLPYAGGQAELAGQGLVYHATPGPPPG